MKHCIGARNSTLLDVYRMLFQLPEDAEFQKPRPPSAVEN